MYDVDEERRLLVGNPAQTSLDTTIAPLGGEPAREYVDVDAYTSFLRHGSNPQDDNLAR